MIRDYVESLEGSEFLDRQARAWVEIREWVDETVPLVTTVTGGSVNGPGSSLPCTESIRAGLPGLLKEYRVSTMLDAPCGDWTWMSQVDLGFIYYRGWDVDLEQIRRNRENYDPPPPGRAHHNRTAEEMLADYQRWAKKPFRLCHFDAVNILTVEKLPRVDLILCRDFLAHLPTDHICAVLDKFRNSRSTYLLASHYPGRSNEFEYHPEHFAWLGYMERPVNLEAPPFSMRKLNWIPEDATPGGVNSGPHELALFQING